MDKTSDRTSDPNPSSSRALLEGLLCSYPGAAEKILRFVRERGLDDDDAVMAMVSILQVNIELEKLLLEMIKGTDEVIDNYENSKQRMLAFEMKLEGQLYGAANMNAGVINVAADRLTRVVQKVDERCGQMLEVSRDLVRVEGALSRAFDIADGKSALDRFCYNMRERALLDVKAHLPDLIREMERPLRRDAWIIYICGIVILLALFGILMVMAVKL